MNTKTPYDLGQPAEDVYLQLARRRQPVIDMGRLMAELTIPSVLPPDGYQTGDNLPGNNQSLTARCVNVLAAVLMLMAFPPGRPMLRYEPVESKLAKAIAQDPELWSKTELGLSRLEEEHRKRMETTTIRTTYTEYIKLLIVAGNACWNHTKLDHPTFHPPTDYVVKRNKVGQQLMVILKECVSVVELPEDVQQLIYSLDEKVAAEKPWMQEADIYTVCRLVEVTKDNRYWECWQEFKGHIIPGTEYDADEDDTPLYAAWMIPVKGKDWGRSYCEEYRGDLFICENHSSALNDGASVAGLSLTFVKPGSRTSTRQVKEAENLSVLTGSAEDLSMFRAEKSQDFNFVTGNLEKAERRLSSAFMLQSSIQRSGERVTAEEWRRMGADLDKAMGGVYTSLSQTTQRHVVMRFIHLHEDSNKDLPTLPEGVIRVAVVTGLDALGRSTDEEALIDFGAVLSKIFGPVVVSQMINASDFIRRLAASKGIRPDGLVHTEQEVAAAAAQQKNDAMKASMIQHGTGPVAGRLAGSLADMATNAQASSITQNPPQPAAGQQQPPA